MQLLVELNLHSEDTVAKTSAKATGESARARRMEEYVALLSPLFGEFEASKGLPTGSLSFTGSFVGSGKQRHYELSVANSGEETQKLWVCIDKDGKLKEEEAPKRK